MTFKVSTKNGQAYRDSQRLVSKVRAFAPLAPVALTRSRQTAYSNGGLFIYDVAHMPTGCGLWPSIWMVGPNWPAGGEIDIIEGVHAITQVRAFVSRRTSPLLIMPSRFPELDEYSVRSASLRSRLLTPLLPVPGLAAFSRPQASLHRS